MLLKRRAFCESGGTGRRARLRGVWIHRTGSSPVSRTITSTLSGACIHLIADVAELADALDSGSSESNFIWVQVPSSAPKEKQRFDTKLSSPLGIKIPNKNSVVTNRLIPKCATLFHLASRLCRFRYRRYQFSFVYDRQLSQPYE